MGATSRKATGYNLLPRLARYVEKRTQFKWLLTDMYALVMALMTLLPLELRCRDLRCNGCGMSNDLMRQDVNHERRSRQRSAKQEWGTPQTLESGIGSVGSCAVTLAPSLQLHVELPCRSVTPQRGWNAWIDFTSAREVSSKHASSLGHHRQTRYT